MFDGWEQVRIRSYRKKQPSPPKPMHACEWKGWSKSCNVWKWRDCQIILNSWIHHQFNRRRIDFGVGHSFRVKQQQQTPKHTNNSTLVQWLCARVCAPESPAGKLIYLSFGVCLTVLVFVSCFFCLISYSPLFSMGFITTFCAMTVLCIYVCVNELHHEQ